MHTSQGRYRKSLEEMADTVDVEKKCRIFVNLSFVLCFSLEVIRNWWKSYFARDCMIIFIISQYFCYKNLQEFGRMT